MAESSSASTSTSFANLSETETVGLDSDVDSGEVAESEAGPSTKVVSLLDRLRSPTSAGIVRKRKTKANPLPKGRHRYKDYIISLVCAYMWNNKSFSGLKVENNGNTFWEVWNRMSGKF